MTTRCGKSSPASGDNLLVNAQRQALHQLRHDLAGSARGSRKAGAEGRRAIARSLHGLEHHAGAGRHALSHVRRRRRRFRTGRTDPERAQHRRCATSARPGEAAKVKALVNMVMNINTAGLAEGLGLGDALGLDLTMLREVFRRNRRQLARAADRRRRHAEPRSLAAFSPPRTPPKTAASRCTSRKMLGLDLPLAARPRNNTTAMIAEGLGELDKSGIAELTFKNRHKHGGDHV